MLDPVGQLGLSLGQQDDFLVDARRLAASVDLRDPPHTRECVGAGAEHQLLQIPDLGQVSCLRCREDALPQTPYVVLDLPPVDRRPVGDLVLRSVRRAGCGRSGLRRPSHVCRHGVQLALRFRCLWSSFLHGLTRPTSAPFQAGTSAPIRPVMRGTADGGVSVWFPVSCCLSATGIRLLGLPAPAGELGLPCGWLIDPKLKGFYSRV